MHTASPGWATLCPAAGPGDTACLPLISSGTLLGGAEPHGSSSDRDASLLPLTGTSGPALAQRVPTPCPGCAEQLLRADTPHPSPAPTSTQALFCPPCCFLPHKLPSLQILKENMSRNFFQKICPKLLLSIKCIWSPVSSHAASCWPSHQHPSPWGPRAHLAEPGALSQAVFPYCTT